MIGLSVKAAAGAAMAGATLSSAAAGPRRLPAASPEKLPRWRGFNLLEMFQRDPPDPAAAARGYRAFADTDFEWISDWGFDFVRLPMDYRIWTDPADWTRINDDALRGVDEAVALGEKKRIHVCLNFHRAPGYTVASPPEERSLWTDEEAQRVCALHWAHFAHRYKGIPSRQLSFDLFNEPAHVTPEAHRAVVQKVATAIRAEDPNRLIICDGRDWGNTPPEELLGLHVASSTRGYQPMALTHYRAEWIHGSADWPEPAYPLHEGAVTWDKAYLQTHVIDPWKELEQKGMGVMVGEFGAYNKTPHQVVMPWLKDYLALWKDAGWGWALWNFRGSFGILDSGRADVAYEDWHGHKLDRNMLTALQAG